MRTQLILSGILGTFGVMPVSPAVATPLEPPAVAIRPAPAAVNTDPIAGTRIKRVLIRTDSAALAIAKAEDRNPGWHAFSARRVGKCLSGNWHLLKHRYT